MHRAIRALTVAFEEGKAFSARANERSRRSVLPHTSEVCACRCCKMASYDASTGLPPAPSECSISYNRTLRNHSETSASVRRNLAAENRIGLVRTRSPRRMTFRVLSAAPYGAFVLLAGCPDRVPFFHDGVLFANGGSDDILRRFDLASPSLGARS